MQLRKYFALTIALGLLVSCSFPSTHPDAAKNNPATYKADLKDCTQAYPETPDGVYLKQRISCLKLKGWQ